MPGALAVAALLLLAGGAAPTPSAAVVEFPGLRIFAQEKRVEADAAFVVVDEAYFLEYLAVSPQGKAHESLLEVRCAPDKLHLGLLLCGLEPKPEVQFHGEARELKGPRVAIEIEWGEGAGRKRVRIEDLLFDARMGAPPPPAGFAFTGSRFVKGFGRDAPKEIFAANASGSVIALYHDPDAVLDIPHLTGGDVPLISPSFRLPEIVTWVPGDERIRPATALLPARGTPAVLHLRPEKNP